MYIFYSLINVGDSQKLSFVLWMHGVL